MSLGIDISKIEAIDPPGCGCTECIIGEYIPYDSPYIDEVLEAVLDGVITPRNNLNDGTLIIYRVNGSVQSETNSTMLSGSDFVIVQPSDYYWDGDEDDEAPVDVSKVEEIEDDEAKEKAIMSILHGAEVTNPSTSTFIAYRSRWGEAGIIELYNFDGEPSILWYDL